MNWRELFAWMQALWTVAYGLIIWRSWLDKRGGMRPAASMACFIWESAMVMFFLTPGSATWWLVLSWAACNVVIWAQIWAYSKSNVAWQNVFFAAAAVYAVMLVVMKQPCGIGLVAAMVNLVASISFVVMLLQRADVAGQSFYIAAFKFLASLGSLATIQAGEWYYLVPMLLALAVDVAYIALLVRQCRRQGVNFWLRFP